MWCKLKRCKLKSHYRNELYGLHIDSGIQKYYLNVLEYLFEEIL
jgi:hypothetical protein